MHSKQYCIEHAFQAIHNLFDSLLISHCQIFHASRPMDVSDDVQEDLVTDSVESKVKHDRDKATVVEVWWL